MSEKHIGKVIQVIGPVLDIQFKDGELPDLLNAIEIDNHGQKLVVEVAQLTGDNVARCIAMSSTDGLVRGTDAVDTGESIRVPVGDQCLGRVFNLLGEPVDNKPAPTPEAYWPIHRPAPSYEEQQSTTEILETGIKVVDLIWPSVLLMAMQRATLSPVSCATSTTSFWPWLSISMALSRSGSSPSLNWMSSTGPMTWITLPMCFSDIGYNSFS